MKNEIELKKKTYEQLQQTVIELTLKNCLLEKALDNACEELENFSYGTTDPGFKLMSFDEWKEWCMK